MEKTKQTVLIVEDDPLDVRVISRALKEIRNIDFHLFTVNSFSKITDWCENNTANVILLDLTLPDSHHDETVSRFMQLNIDTPVIILTGLDDEDIDSASICQGVQDYLLKDEISPRTLKRAVRHAQERFKLQQEMKELIDKDALTNVFSRRYFFDHAQAAFERFQRYATPVSIIMIDLDNFKKINDEHGHLAGDAVLFSVAQGMNNLIRSPDILARYGGEEFVVLLPNTNIDGASSIARRINQNIESLHQSSKDNPSATISCGVAEACPNQKNLESLLNDADEQLYKAKQAGKNTVMPMQ